MGRDGGGSLAAKDEAKQGLFFALCIGNTVISTYSPPYFSKRNSLLLNSTAKRLHRYSFYDTLFA